MTALVDGCELRHIVLRSPMRHTTYWQVASMVVICVVICVVDDGLREGPTVL
jgi:hypothetical protein